jgi:hypothetical protein
MWTKVQLPFDALIAAAPSDKACPTGCSGDSYIPRHVLWFRKQFTLPSSWNRVTWSWLDLLPSDDGLDQRRQVAYHDCG